MIQKTPNETKKQIHLVIYLSQKREAKLKSLKVYIARQTDKINKQENQKI